MEISTLQQPSVTERASTQNLSSVGARLVTRRSIERNERLMIRSLVGEQKTIARVVYCQRLKDGRFGVGMQFLGPTVDWPNDLTGKPIR